MPINSLNIVKNRNNNTSLHHDDVSNKYYNVNRLIKYLPSLER